MAPFVHVAAVRRLRRLPVLRGRPAHARTATRAWSSGARRPERCRWSPPVARRTRAAPPTTGATRCWRSPRPRIASPSATTRRGAERLSVVPTVMRSGDAFNVVPADGELLLRHARRRQRGVRRRAARPVPDELDDVALEARMQRMWPGMDSAAATAGLLERAGARLGRPIVGGPARRRQRRQPLRAAHPADRRRPRPARRRRPHARGVRATRRRCASAPRWRWRSRRRARRKLDLRRGPDNVSQDLGSSAEYAGSPAIL